MPQPLSLSLPTAQPSYPALLPGTPLHLKQRETVGMLLSGTSSAHGHTYTVELW